MTKHTPGPWRWAVGNGYNDETYVFRGNDELCEVFDDCDSEALPDYANARLMAAAPTMLDALHLVQGIDIDPRVLKIVDDAVRMAEGR